MFFPLDREVILILRCLRTLESNVLINQDHEDGDEVGVYLCMKENFAWPYFLFIVFFLMVFLSA